MKFRYKGDREVELLGIKFKPNDEIEVSNPDFINDFNKIPEFEEIKPKTSKKGDKT